MMASALLSQFLYLTNFSSPFLRTAVPSVAVAFALQTAAGVPSIFAQTERFFDVSGSATFLAVTILSLYMPSLRAHTATELSFPSLRNLVVGVGNNAADLNWRQVGLSAAVALWSVRLGSYLFLRVLQEGHDSRFDEVRQSPSKFTAAFVGQAVWVSICLMPVLVVNSVPPAMLAAVPLQFTDILGLILFTGGLIFEVVADRQKSRWLQHRREKLHDEQFMTSGLWRRSQYPNYFGECTLWTGIAIVATGVLVTRPVQVGLGLSGLTGNIFALVVPFMSPAFVAFLLLKVTGVPLSEMKYDEKYGRRKDYQKWKRDTPKLFPKLF